MDPEYLAVDVGGGEPIAVPPPVLATLMQQMQVLADGQQALAGRIDSLDNNQGPQQAQQQQPPQPEHGYVPAGGALAGGPWLLPGAGAVGVPPPAAQQASGQLATASAAAKANAKLAAERWRSHAGQQCFVARGCFYVPKELNTALLGLILKKAFGGSATPDFERLGCPSILPTSASRGHTNGPSSRAALQHLHLRFYGRT